MGPPFVGDKPLGVSPKPGDVVATSETLPVPRTSDPSRNGSSVPAVRPPQAIKGAPNPTSPQTANQCFERLKRCVTTPPFTKESPTLTPPVGAPQESVAPSRFHRFHDLRSPRAPQSFGETANRRRPIVPLTFLHVRCGTLAFPAAATGCDARSADSPTPRCREFRSSQWHAPCT